MGTDDPVWHLIAYSAGTGGSMLIIGSAAGVVAMGMERISVFLVFEKHILARFNRLPVRLTSILFHWTLKENTQKQLTLRCENKNIGRTLPPSQSFIFVS